MKTSLSGRWPAIRRAAWLLIAIMLLARVHLIAVRLYDSDEFEHLHMSYCVANGLVPYRDFFEHHGPLPAFMTAGLVAKLGPEPVLLTANRLLSYGFVWLTVIAVWKLTRRSFGHGAAALALAWLVTLPWFVQKSLEWRPDVPAMCLVAWSAWFWGRRVRSPWTVSFPAGLLLGLAFLCTQKVVFLGAGIVVGAVATRRAKRQPVGGQLLAGLVGFAVPWLMCSLWFYNRGALEDLVRCFFYYPLIWPTHESTILSLLMRDGWVPAHWGLAFLGLVAGTYRVILPRSAALGLSPDGLKPALRTSRPRQRGEAILVGGCLFHFIGLLLVPAVYAQYYLLGFPLLASLTGGVTVSLWKTASAHLARAAPMSLAWVPLVAALAATGIGVTWRFWDLWPAVVALWRSIEQGDAQQLYSLAQALDFEIVDLASLGTLMTTIAVWLVRRSVGNVLVWIALVLPAGGRILMSHLYWRNDTQLDNLRLLHAVVLPDQPVLDGFSGLGCLRPHAFYWWWINQHTRPLMVREQALPRLQRVVELARPAAILYDVELSQLHGVLNRAIEAHYRPIERQPKGSGLIILLRDDLPDPTAGRS